MKIILASSSPHRAKLLQEHKVDFTPFSPELEEVFNPKLSAEEVAMDLGRQKCRAVWNQISPGLGNGGAIVLGADTIVINSAGELLSKAKDAAQARAYMKNRSSSKEKVVTGFCLRHDAGEICGHEVTKISYKEIPAAVQEGIIMSNEWQGVCGGLKVEGKIAPYVKEIIGDHDNIRGLPMKRILALLKAII